MTEVSAQALKDAKNKRRCAKSSVTRAGNGLDYLLKNDRPKAEVEESLANLELVYKKLIEKHEEYIQLVGGDEEFATEEQWIDDCQQRFMQLRIRTKDYLKNKSQQGQSVESNISENEGMPEETLEPVEPEITDTDGGNEANPGSGLSQQGEGQETVSLNDNNDSSLPVEPVCGFKMEKPKMPKFSGDVREYGVFRDDFKHAVESRYSKRDAITYLRACLQGKPLELIKGIGNDYDAAWQYLESIYGDPRYVSDQVTQDLSKFRPLKEGEDSRFCDLVHLVKRSFNTLKGVGRPYDMDNNHMLSLIEQKMCVEDRKIWSRELEKEKGLASLEGLMSWMETEMKSRMRATAPLRNAGSSVRSVNQLSGGKPPRCWLCKTSTHWVDQCEKFKSMSPEERLKTVREKHACFSCLKRAGRKHRASNCNRRKQCTQKINGEQCKYYHHVLLHPASPTASVGVASVKNDTEAMLPVITVKMSEKDNRYERGNVLLDSGAQISLICTNTAKSLGLRGKDVSITIKKVGGEEEVLATKVYQVPITSLESGAKFTVKAVGIPQISDSIPQIDVGNMAKEIGITETKIYRESGPIDILIGIDHAYMHTGESKRFGSVVARHSPLGWLLFGATPGAQQTSRVFHVQYTKPVDLTDFWTSETMGVRQPVNDIPKLSKIE